MLGQDCQCSTTKRLQRKNYWIPFSFDWLLSKFNQLSMVAGDVLSETADEEESKTDFEESGTSAEQYFDTTLTEQHQRCQRTSPQQVYRRSDSVKQAVWLVISSISENASRPEAFACPAWRHWRRHDGWKIRYPLWKLHLGHCEPSLVGAIAMDYYENVSRYIHSPNMR